MDANKLFIALATYNGARFLAEQLDSIRSQTVSDWTLLVRDDGSSDATPSILRELAGRDPRIRVLEDQRGRQGPAANYGLLLQACLDQGAGYVFFSDQDDVWHPDKVARQMALLAAKQQSLPPGTPLLIHSDLTVVDPDLNVINASFMRHQGISHEPVAPLRTLLVQNFVTGCTCLINRPLAERSMPIPSGIIMHDWWLALCAAALGEIHYLPESTLLYRQHDNNQVGATGFWTTLNIRRKSWHIISKESLREFAATVHQARALKRHLDARSEDVDPKSLTLVHSYCDLFARSSSTLSRALQIRRLGVRRQDFVRNSLLMLRLMGVKQPA